MYDPVTGSITLDDLDGVGGIAFLDLGPLGFTPTAHNTLGAFTETTPNGIYWLTFDPPSFSGSGFNLGAIATPGLTTELNKYAIGVVKTGSGVPTPTPIPIVGPAGTFLPDPNPWEASPDPDPDPDPDPTSPAYFIYDPATGNLTLDGLTNVGGVVVESQVGPLNGAAANSLGGFTEVHPSTIYWLFFSPLTGDGFDLGNIAPRSLNQFQIDQELFVGMVVTGSGNPDPVRLPTRTNIPEPEGLPLALIALAATTARRRRSA